MTKNQMIRRCLSPSTCKDPVLQRKLRRVQKDVIEQIYRNPMSNNKRREIFYSVLDNPRCRVGKGKFFLWSEYCWEVMSDVE